MANFMESYDKRIIQERWAEVTRRIELQVDIKEMNDNGQYTSIEVHPSSDILCGGMYQLKQVNELTNFNELFSSLFPTEFDL